MDIPCPQCGEPWDIYELHDVPGKTFHEARREFYRVGCEVFGCTCAGIDYEYSAEVSALYDMLGDDIDGAAAMIEDFGLI